MKLSYRLLLCSVIVCAPALLSAQTITPPPAKAPVTASPATASPVALSPVTSSPTNPAGTPQPIPLTLAAAEQIALKNHPRIQEAQNLARAAQSQVTEARAAYYPYLYGSLSGALSLDNARIGAGTFNDPRVFDKYANGLTANQLVTDFGRTHEQVKSTSLRAQSQKEDVVTSQADVLLAVDQAYYGALKAQAVLNVAQQTVRTRQLSADQIAALAKSQLKSDLDVSFANVDLAEAQLLLIQAQNDTQVAFAELSATLGYADTQTFQLTDQPLPPAPPPDATALMQQAMANRPEIISQRLALSAAETYAKAERDLYFPTVSAVGAAGLIPFHAANENGLDNQYAAAGFNVNIPIFNGHLYGSLHSEASARAEAQSQALRDLTDRVAQEVRTAWLNANSAYQKLTVTAQLLSQATLSLNLAQSRYNLGLSSIIELSQSQLNLTQAQITDASARYDYQTQQSVLNYEVGNLH